jgi:hypothetical protein
MIGHNNGPPLGDITDVAGRARLFYWRKAHKAAWRTPPIEIVNLRHRAAEQLGLSYKDYASILMDRGHRPRAIVFALAGTLVRTRRSAVDTTMMPGVQQKLRRLRECSLFVIAGDPPHAERRLSAESANHCVDQIAEACSVTFADRIVGNDNATALTLRRLLTKHQIPPSQTIFIGATREDEACAEGAKVARFFWAWHYFAAGPAGTA